LCCHCLYPVCDVKASNSVVNDSVPVEALVVTLNVNAIAGVLCPGLRPIQLPLPVKPGQPALLTPAATLLKFHVSITPDGNGFGWLVTLTVVGTR